MSSESARLVEQRMIEVLACHTAMTRMLDGHFDHRGGPDLSVPLMALPGNLRQLIALTAHAIQAHLQDLVPEEVQTRISQLADADGSWRLSVVAERYVQGDSPSWGRCNRTPHLEVEMPDGARFEMVSLLSSLRVGRLAGPDPSLFGRA